MCRRRISKVRGGPARWVVVDIFRPLRNAKTRLGQLHFRNLESVSALPPPVFGEISASRAQGCVDTPPVRPRALGEAQIRSGFRRRWEWHLSPHLPPRRLLPRRLPPRASPLHVGSSRRCCACRAPPPRHGPVRPAFAPCAGRRCVGDAPVTVGCCCPVAPPRMPRRLEIIAKSSMFVWPSSSSAPPRSSRRCCRRFVAFTPAPVCEQPSPVCSSTHFLSSCSVPSPPLMKTTWPIARYIAAAVGSGLVLLRSALLRLLALGPLFTTRTSSPTGVIDSCRRARAFVCGLWACGPVGLGTEHQQLLVATTATSNN
jgi:hypothetical protein